MTAKQQIYKATDNLSEEYLDELYLFIQDFTRYKQAEKSSSFMSKLKKIKIEAPEDFSSNIDLYVTGEKSVT
jgi:hypothetical protein